MYERGKFELPDVKEQVKADPFTLESLIAWLSTKDANEEYPYHDCKGNCLIGQYAASVGIDWYKLHYPSTFDAGGVRLDVVVPKPWTFGAALDRARALQAQQRGA